MRLLLQLFVVFLVCGSSCYGIALPQPIINADVPGCGEGWVYSMDLGACYYLSTNSTTFEKANTFCEDIGGALVSIYDDKEYDTVSIYIDMRGFVEPYRIGLKAFPYDPYFVWLDNKFAYYTHWINGTDPAHNNYDSCYGWSKTMANNGWLQVDCQIPLPFICKRHPKVSTVQHINGTSGDLNSPNYPAPYDADSSSVYFINAPQDTQILLTFKYIGIDAGSFINIYDDGKLLETITNQSPLQTITSTTNQLRVEFNASKEGNEKYFGWYAKFNTSNIVFSMEGSFTSPNYPNNYDNNELVVKKVTVPDQFVTIFSIWDFASEEGGDFLDLSNSYDTRYVNGHPDLPAEYCLDGSFTMKWTSDGSNVDRGFNLTYLVVPNTHCS